MIKKSLSIDNIQPNKNSEDDQIISKYFDNVITSFGVDSAKRPEVATQWAIEKERWLNNKDQVLKKNLSKVIKTKNYKYSLMDLQKIHLQELTKRSQFLTELNKHNKLPKITHDDLQTDFKIQDNGMNVDQFSQKDVDNEETSLNSGAGIMREIARQIQEQNQIYQNLDQLQDKKSSKKFLGIKRNKKLK